MKKHLVLLFVSLCLMASGHVFAQVDSAQLAKAERQIEKDKKDAEKLEKKAERREKKMKKQQRKMERADKKKDKKLKKIEKGEKKLDEIRRDSTGTVALLSVPPADFLYRRNDAV